MTLYAGTASTEYVRIPVTVLPDTDPTTNEVKFSFPASGGIPDTWILGEWEAGGPPYIARVLIGPDTDVELDAGNYDIWLRITDAPEAPTFIADRLSVFAVSTLLASVSQLGDVLGQDIDPENARARQVLTDAGAFIRSYTGQIFTLIEEDEQELRGSWEREFWLPQKPVLDVCAIAIRGRGETIYRTQSLAGVTWTRRGKLFGWGCDWGGDGTVKVTYDHGYSVIPEDIQGVCLGMAARAYATPVAAGPLISHSKQLSQFSETFTYGVTSTFASSLGLTGLEQSVLEKYARSEGG